MSHFIENVLTI